MWKSLLRSANLDELRDLLSPKFFRVFPASKIARAMRELLGNYRDAERFDEALSRRDQALESADLPIRLAPDLDLPGATEHPHGHAVLELYFRQLFDDGPTLLDLRGDRFEHRNGDLAWAPRAVYVEWDESFIGGVRDMYHGFYCDDAEQFERGLEALDLQGVGGVLLGHFGGDEQREIRFEMEHFHEAFHEVLVECDERGRSLHYQFAALGLYLATLYDHLGGLGEAFDVRAAFRAATA